MKKIYLTATLIGSYLIGYCIALEYFLDAFVISLVSLVLYILYLDGNEE